MNTSDTQGEQRWEQGSEFHLMRYDAAEIMRQADTPAGASPYPWGRCESRAYASGRDALHALLVHGQAARGWRRLLVPSYYCQVVVRSLKCSRIEIVLYDDGPQERMTTLGAVQFKPGDVILTVNFYGLGGRFDYRDVARDSVEIIEDHTHDPWSDWAWDSQADWCVASLRKTLPVPDGAMLWTPRDHVLPTRPLPIRERQEASSKKLAAMLMKDLYLNGHPIDKDAFRNLYAFAENSLTSEAAAAMTVWSESLVRTFPLRRMRILRRRNHEVLSQAVQDVQGLEVMTPANGPGACPFSCVIVCDTPERRHHLKENLIGAGVYPAVLWPLEAPVFDGVPAKHKDLSRRMLSLHCDARYTEADMLRVAGLVRKFALSFDEQRQESR